MNDRRRLVTTVINFAPSIEDGDSKEEERDGTKLDSVHCRDQMRFNVPSHIIHSLYFSIREKKEESGNGNGRKREIGKESEARFSDRFPSTSVGSNPPREQ